MLGAFEDAIKAMMSALKKTDPASFKEIFSRIDDGSFDALQRSYKLVGEMLATLNEQESILNLNQLGYLIIAQADLAKVWHDAHTDANSKIAEPERKRKKNGKNRKKI